MNTFDRADRSLFGYKAFIVLSDSMSATDFSAGDLVLSKANDAYWKYLYDHKDQLVPGALERVEQMMPRNILLTTHVQAKLDAVEIEDLA